MRHHHYCNTRPTLQGILFTLLLVLSGPLALSADDIHLGSFPQGQWLDTRWQAYWTFGSDTITLRNAQDQVLWDFSGIVQRFKVTDLPGGGVRLTFDCAKAKRSYRFERSSAKAPMDMEIRPYGSSIGYHTAIPKVTETQLADFKQAVQADKPAALAQVVAAIEATQEGFNSSPTPQADKVATAVSSLLDVAESADFAALEELVRKVEAEGLRDAIVQEMEAAAGRSDAPPKVFLALSVLYGRMGLKTREYAALELAEKAPLPPQVKLNLALIHGRKQLLASSIDADRFMVGDVELEVVPPYAAIFLDGKAMGRGLKVLPGIPAGLHVLRMEADDFEPMDLTVELGVGFCLPVDAALAPKVTARSSTMKIGTLKVARGSLEVEVLSPGTLTIGGQDIALDKPGVLPVSDMEAGEYPLTMTYPNGTVQKLVAIVEGGKTAHVRFEYSPAPLNTPLVATTIQTPSPIITAKTQVFSITIGMTFLPVAGGSFAMGSTNGSKDEKPVHKVNLGSFLLGRTEVTQGQWQATMGNNPSKFKGDNLPVEQVSWLDAVDFCNKLSQKEGLSPAYTINGTNVTWNKSENGYRLPTEAEWEYAARGGTQGVNHKVVYAGGNDPKAVAWFRDNSGSAPHPVARKQPNDLGFYDMSGNVWEWVWDRYGAYTSKSQNDPAGPDSGTLRVSRGGSWFSEADNLRPTTRIGYAPDFRFIYQGFRIARTLQ